MLKVTVISPEVSLFQGSAESVVAPAFDGDVGILTGHAPMMTLLGKGELRVGEGSASKKFNVEGGFLQVLANEVRVVTEKATAV